MGMKSPVTSRRSSGVAKDARWLLGMLALAVLLAVLASRWTFDMWTWQPDELLFRGTAQWVGEHLPDSLWAMEEYKRGTQRLNAFLLAFSLDAFGSYDGFRVARWIVTLSFVSTSVPVFLLTRRAGASAPWSAVAGIMCVLVPWSVLAGTFLTEGLAYPLYAWACLAIWHAAARPGNRSDVIALAAIGAAMLARTGLVVLIVPLVVAVLGRELRLAGSWAASGSRLAGLARRHWILGAALAVAAAIAVTGTSSQLTGAWYDNAHLRWSRLPEAAGYTLGVVAAGLAFVPVIAALALALGDTVRPRSPERLALALLVAGTIIATVLTMDMAAFEERYVFLVTAPCVAAFAVAAGAGGLRSWAVLASGSAVAVAVLSRSWTLGENFWTYLHFPGPAQSFQATVVREGINARVPDALRLDGDVLTALLIAGATILTLAFATRRAPAQGAASWRSWLSVATAVALVVTGMLQARWAMREFLEHGGGGSSLADRVALDRALGDRSAGLWLPPASVGDPRMFWREARYYNLGLRNIYRLGASQRAALLPGDRITRVDVDARSGAVRARDGRPLPPLMALLTWQVSAPLAGRIVAHDEALDIAVVDSGAQPRVRWQYDGAWADGRLRPNARARVRVPAPPPGACLRVTVRTLPGGRARVRFAGEVFGTRVVSLGSKQVRTVLLPLQPAREPDTISIAATGLPVLLPDQRQTVAQVVPETVTPCV